jgi:uncharacterized protein (DUF433 family)
MSSSSVVAAFTEDQTERLTGVSKRQLRHWDRTDFFVPSLAFEDRRAQYSRLYSFRDLVSLKVLNSLRNDANVPLQHLREVKAKLARLGDDIWAKTTLYVLNRKVIFHNPDGEVREEVLSGQAILGIPLQVITSGVEDAVKAMRQRDVTQIGKIEKQKNVAHNKPVVAGTRIPVHSVKAFAEAGYSIAQIRNEYPTLTDDDIRTAIDYNEAA